MLDTRCRQAPPTYKVQPRKFSAPRSVERSQEAYLMWVRGTRGPYPQLVFFNPGEPPTIGRSVQSSLLSIQMLHPDLQDKSLDHSSRLSSR